MATMHDKATEAFGEFERLGFEPTGYSVGVDRDGETELMFLSFAASADVDDFLDCFSSAELGESGYTVRFPL